MNAMKLKTVGTGILVGAFAMMVTATPLKAESISIGGFFGSGDGTRIGGFVHIGDRPAVAVRPVPVVRPAVVVPRPVIVAPVAAPAVVVERVWVEVPRVIVRQVPVLDVAGRLVAYREVQETVMEGHWEMVARPVVGVAGCPTHPPHMQGAAPIAPAPGRIPDCGPRGFEGPATRPHGGRVPVTQPRLHRGVEVAGPAMAGLDY